MVLKWTEGDLSELFDLRKSTHILNVCMNQFVVDPSSSAASQLNMFICCLPDQTRAFKIKWVEVVKA